MAEILVDISILTHDTGVPSQPFDPKECLSANAGVL